MKKPINKFKTRLAKSRKETNPFLQQEILSEHTVGPYQRLERRFLAGIFENAHHCIRPVNEKFAKKEYSYRPNSLYLASASLSLRYVKQNQDLSHYEFVDNTPWRHLTYSDRTSIRRFEEIVLCCLDRCIETLEEERSKDTGPLLIALNEFGFPFFRQDKARGVFLDKLNSISEKKNAYIVCGTSHSFQTKQNVAIFTHPNEGAAIEHPKYTPAINLGENLKPRENLDWKYYSMEIGRIGILVCFDVIDPNILLRQVYYSRDVQASNKINIYVIPTFSANDFVRDQAELLSYLTKSVVLYVNCQYADPQDLSNLPRHDSPRRRSHGLFIGGEDVTWDIGVKSPYSDLCEIFSPTACTIDPPDDEHWASIRTHKLAYREIIQALAARGNEFSPLFREILSLAKPDPALAG